MDLTLSSRIKAIFTKVFCTFFIPLPRIRAICRPTGALLRSTRFRHGSIPKRPLIPTFLSNDNEVERRFAERARNQIAPPPGFSIELRYFNSKLQMEAQRHGKQTRYASFFLLPFSFNFHLYFKNSVQSSISFHLYSSSLLLFIHFIFPIVSNLSKIPSNRYHSMSLRLFLPSFLIYFHFSVIRITLFHKIYPNRQRSNFSRSLFDFCSIFFFFLSLLNFSSSKISIQ